MSFVRYENRGPRRDGRIALKLGNVEHMLTPAQARQIERELRAARATHVAVMREREIAESKDVVEDLAALAEKLLLADRDEQTVTLPGGRFITATISPQKDGAA